MMFEFIKKLFSYKPEDGPSNCDDFWDDFKKKRSCKPIMKASFEGSSGIKLDEKPKMVSPLFKYSAFIADRYFYKYMNDPSTTIDDYQDLTNSERITILTYLGRRRCKYTGRNIYSHIVTFEGMRSCNKFMYSYVKVDVNPKDYKRVQTMIYGFGQDEFMSEAIRSLIGNGYKRPKEVELPISWGRGN